MNKDAGEKVKCPSCQNEVGTIENVEGLDFLKVNGILVRALHGTCQCGEEFHYSVGDRILAKLVRKQ